MVKKNKIAVFGGSFDPVHLAHTEIAMEALKMQGVKKVIFVPAYAPPHKSRRLACIDDRIAMLKLAVRNMENVEISCFEAEKRDIVYSFLTLDHFGSLYPKEEILMVIGSDSLKELDAWKNAAYLTSKYRFLVAKRPDIIIDGKIKYLDRCVFMDVLMKDISSTRIRRLLKKGDARAKEFLDPQVYGYIKEYGLYK